MTNSDPVWPRQHESAYGSSAGRAAVHVGGGACPAPRRDAVASVPFRLLLSQAVSAGGSLEGILWLCQLYPNVHNLFVFNLQWLHEA